MKATGIVRRIDDLGRVVVPKEIRRTLRIREGEPMEIFTGREGEIVLKKYSPIGELSAFAREYAEALAQNTGYLACISDHDQIVAASGPDQKDYMGKTISRDLEQAIAQRQSVCEDGSGRKLPGVVENDPEEYYSVVAQPILAAGDAIGAVVMIGKKEGIKPGETEKKLVAVAAGFLGKQMEE
mgnify:FL=1